VGCYVLGQGNLENNPAPTECFVPFNFASLESGESEAEWKSRIVPKCITEKVRNMVLVPKCRASAVVERESWITASSDDTLFLFVVSLACFCRTVVSEGV
jgi:hypothetical protein